MQASPERLRIEEDAFDYEKRRYFDTVTWLAEVLPGSMRTPFEYSFDGQELYAVDGGKLAEIFDTAVREAEEMPEDLAFELRRRKAEKQEYNEMVDMMRGSLPNTMVVVSDFPSELMTATKDVGGYNVTRKQTMLRVLAKTPGGTLKMYSQSLDGSDRQALEALYRHLGHDAQPGELLGQRMHIELDETEQEFLIDELTGVYDRQLAVRYGGQWHAGQLNGERRNTYDFARSQTDLLNAYLATTNGFTGNKKDYNLAAAMEARFRNHLSRPYSLKHDDYDIGIVAHVMAMDEMTRAGEKARATGKSYSGCGITAGAPGEGFDAASQLEEAGYGNQSTEAGEDQYGSLTFECPKGHQNQRPRNKLIPRCKVCGISVKC